MLRAHTVEEVRAAEAALMATVPEGTLMQRAAYGLANAVLDLLGGGYGRRVLLLVGAGHNGGDALYAGAVLARRGALVEAWLLSTSAHEAGLAALRTAGLHVRTDLRNEKINAKVREHSLAHVPVLVVVGRKEAESRSVALRRLGSQAQEVLTLEEAVAHLAAEALPPDLRSEPARSPEFA